MSSDVAIRAEDLGKRYRIGGPTPDRSLRESIAGLLDRRRRAPEGVDLWALRHVGFELVRGRSLGIIGANGAGKSTLLKVLTRVTAPTEGRVVVSGRVAALLEVGTGFHPELTGRENIYLSGAILGMTRHEIRHRFDEIVDFSGVLAFLDMPLKRFSSGMAVRLAFSVAAHLEPDILVVDEVLAVGDAEFQRRCLGRLQAAAGEGRTVLFVSHNMHAIRTLCDSAMELRMGGVVAAGDPADVVRHYLSTPVEWFEAARTLSLGDDRVRLVGLRVLDEAGQTTGMRHSSQAVQIEMVLDLSEVHSSLTVGFELATVEGVLVLWSNHTDGPEDQWPRLRRGRNVVTCTIPPGMLNGGRYTISPRIAYHWADWVVNTGPLATIDVTLDHPNSPMWLTTRPGAIAPVLRWHGGPGRGDAEVPASAASLPPAGARPDGSS